MANLTHDGFQPCRFSVTSAANPEITLRYANAGDVTAIAEVHAQSWMVAYTDFLSAEEIRRAVPERCSVAKWSAVVASSKPFESLLVAERRGSVIGFVQFGVDPEDRALGSIHRLYVHPTEWGRGAAQFLMEAALTQLAESGFSLIALWTPGAARARRFYERNGFVDTGVERQLELIPGVAVSDWQFVRKASDAD